ncbi:HAD-IIB family hydrolase [Paenibacillus qinlingensis]|uniref:Cof subfamily protein (Haloacid dehalogenase superfamily) n=1 Tax=Paenibacillus qinlingensis TaxID=1837343 RepID=A0ABU1NQX4_9BACL|nr:HAD-IIB family hydrolase [Paenibacillus qinlingensis]MDR6549823.1 Cof subfamily protein (haloacid dehalogenase superfamily) [Paenibacillus qinlingensis]
MKNTYFLTDLDGTLLRSQAKPSEFTISVLTQALEQGMVVSYATARSYQSSQAVASDIPWRYPLVLYNGAMLFDPIQKRVLDGRWLDSERCNTIIKMGKTLGITPLLFALDEKDNERVMHERLERTGDLQFLASRPNDPRFQEVDELQNTAELRTLILTYIGLFNELLPLKTAVEALFGSEVHIHLMKDNYIEGHYFLEFSHREANKQMGLRLWAALVGCASEDVTAFGDNLNDTGMFLEAGYKVAVANAHPDLLQMADEIAGSNDEDGVAAYIAARSGGLGVNEVG